MRFTDAVVFSFDGDAAGRRAAGRALEAALPHASDTRSFKFLFLPPQHDPDSYVRAHGVDAFESLVASSVPLSRQIVAAASDGCDLGLAEGRAKMLSQAKLLWHALPVGALRPQLAREFATLAQLDLDEVMRLWSAGRGQPAAARATPAPFPRAASRRPLTARPNIRKPADSVARMLLLRNEWWDTLSNSERDAIAACESWHGELFRWLDRNMQDHGALPWAALRVGLSHESWATQATQLIDAPDAADAGLEPLAVDLHNAIAQLMRGEPFKMPRALPGALPHG